MKKMKFYKLTMFVITIFVITMAQTNVWDGTADTTWFTDNKEATEFTITTAKQLAGLAVLVSGSVNNGTYDMEGKIIRLGNNIMLNDTTDWQNWMTDAPANTWTSIGKTPMGVTPNPFSGTFDGAGFEISGFYQFNTMYDGLFNMINSNGTVKNLGVISFYITDRSSGSLVGVNRGRGGLASINRGIIDNCYAIGNIDFMSKNNIIGGLVGSNRGTVINCYAKVDISSFVSSSENNIGGLVGNNEGRTPYIGAIINSYATGNVLGLGNGNIGGLVGYNDYGTIANSFAIGSVVAGKNDNIGGLVGYQSNYDSKITYCYYDKETSGQSDNDGKRGTPKTTAEMQNEQFVVQLNLLAVRFSGNGWSYSNGEYPKLSNMSATFDTSSYFANGNGTEENPYIIKTPKQLENFSWLVGVGGNFDGKYIKLGNNIMLNDTNNWNNWSTTAPSNSWTPIGNYNDGFSGIFDGAGYVVNGVYINDTSFTSQHQGLFGVVGNNGTIRNLGVVASYVKGYAFVGGLAGLNTAGDIINCYVIGNVSAAVSFVGGLAGLDSAGSIINCYAAGMVSGSENVGGLVGVTYSGSIINSYYDRQANGRNDTDKGTPKITTEMRQKSTYTGWDFENIWAIDGEKNYGYPYLLNYNSAIPIRNTANKKMSEFAFAGIRNGQINLRLQAGNYTVELYNLQGRLVNKVEINAINGINATGLKIDNLSKGIFILNVKQAGYSVLQNKIVVR